MAYIVHVHSIICMGNAVEIRDRIKKLFGRQEDQPVIETSQRYPVPAGFIDNRDVALAVLLKKGNKCCGARLYTYEKDGVSLEKKLLGNMDESQWYDFKNKLDNAKAKGYVEDGEKTPIPSALCEGKRGFYAISVKRYNDAKDAFVSDGVNIYQIDENLRNVYIRSMSEKTWRNFDSLIAKVQKEEEEIRQASLSKFAVLSEK